MRIVQESGDRMFKKCKKVLAIVLVATIALTGCNRGAGGSSSNDIELRISWWGGESRHEATMEAIKRFEEKYPNIKVSSEYSGFDGYQEKVTIQVGGGTEPDIMQLNWSWLNILSPDGTQFLDLESMATLNLSDNFSDFELDSGRINGILNAVPVGTTGGVLYLNKTTYDSFGVDIPETWDDYFAAAEQFDDGYYPLDLDLKNNRVWMLIVSWLQQEYGKPLIKEDNSEVGFTIEEIASGFEFYAELVDAGVVPSIEERAGQGNVELFEMPAYIDGRYAGVYEWTSSASKYAAPLEETNQELVLANFPTSEDALSSGIISKPSLLWGISKNSNHPEEAALLLNFLLNDKEAASIMGLERGIPSSTAALEVLEEDGLLESGLEVDGTEFVKENIDFQTSPYYEDANLQSTYRQVTESFGYGRISAEEAAKQIFDAITDKLKSVQ